MVTDLKALVAESIPTMLMFGMRHALDVDHITADNLVRMHNAKKGSMVGTGFRTGHTVSIFGELLLLIYVIGSATNGIAFWGGMMGALALATIGVINIYSMKRGGRTGSLFLQLVTRTNFFRTCWFTPVTGLVFGIGFDTATQISPLT